MPERCIDASIALKWVLKGEPYRTLARRFLRDNLAARIDLIAPPMFEYEVESVLQRRVFHGLLTVGEADKAIGALARIRVQTLNHPDMVNRARGIARLCNQERIYDSLYAALAVLRGCEFWTADKAFHDAVKSSLAFVKYLVDYK